MRRGHRRARRRRSTGADARAPLVIGLAAWQSLREGQAGRGYEGWISGGSGFVGRHLVEAFDDVLAPVARRGRRDRRRGRAAQRRRVRARRDGPRRDPQRLRRLEREGWAAYVGATRNVVERRRRARDPRLDRLGVRRDRRVERGDAAEPDQPLRDAEGGERAGGRHGRAHLGRAGPFGRAAQPGRRLRLLRRLDRARAARGRAVHGLGGSGHQQPRHADARLRRGAADRADRRGRPPRRSSTAAAASRSTGASSRCGRSRRSGSTATCSSSARRPSRGSRSRTTRGSTRRRPPPRSASSCRASTTSCAGWRGA